MNTYDATLAPRISQLLEQRLVELRALLKPPHLAGGESVGGEVTDFKDAANDESIAAVDDAQAAQANVELTQVMAARRRLADEDYGRCLECGEPIDLRRLLAVPWAPYCLDCQAELEHKVS
jgi:DnaK suppressor protein